MPNRQDYEKVAQELEHLLENRAFVTITRLDITDLVRKASGVPNTRVKSLIARDLTAVMEQAGLRFFPALEDIESRESTHVYRTDSVFSKLVEMLAHPSLLSDVELGATLKKIKGTWNWNNTENKVKEFQHSA